MAERVSNKFKDMEDSLPLGDIDQVFWHDFVRTSDETNKLKKISENSTCQESRQYAKIYIM